MADQAIKRRIRPVAKPEAPPVPEPLRTRYNVYAGSRSGPWCTITVGEPDEAKARALANEQWAAGVGKVRITVEHEIIVGEKVRKPA